MQKHEFRMFVLTQSEYRDTRV